MRETIRPTRLQRERRVNQHIQPPVDKPEQPKNRLEQHLKYAPLGYLFLIVYSYVGLNAYYSIFNVEILGHISFQELLVLPLTSFTLLSKTIIIGLIVYFSFLLIIGHALTNFRTVYRVRRFYRISIAKSLLVFFKKKLIVALFKKFLVSELKGFKNTDMQILVLATYDSFLALYFTFINNDDNPITDILILLATLILLVGILYYINSNTKKIFIQRTGLTLFLFSLILTQYVTMYKQAQNLLRSTAENQIISIHFSSSTHNLIGKFMGETNSTIFLLDSTKTKTLAYQKKENRIIEYPIQKKSIPQSDRNVKPIADTTAVIKPDTIQLVPKDSVRNPNHE